MSRQPRGRNQHQAHSRFRRSAAGFPRGAHRRRACWDGGILSNTPTEAIFDDMPRKNSLNLAAHLWNPLGNRPTHYLGSAEPAKGHPVFKPDASHIARQRQMHRLRHIINDLARLLPEETRKRPEVRELTAYGCPTTMHVGKTLAPQLRMKTTPRTSISVHRACASVGRPATPTPRARSNRRRGERIRSARRRDTARGRHRN